MLKLNFLSLNFKQSCKNIYFNEFQDQSKEKLLIATLKCGAEEPCLIQESSQTVSV
jgi:hypothetical protein